jgi:hypothetical protein
LQRQMPVCFRIVYNFDFREFFSLYGAQINPLGCPRDAYEKQPQSCGILYPGK